MRARLWASVAASAVVVVIAGVAWAASGGGGSTSTEHRFTRMYTRGPEASCDGDSCGIFVITPVPVRLPAGHTYSATVTVSFGYATHGDGEFRLHAGLKNGGATIVLPRLGRTLGPAPNRTSTTLVFELLGVPGGTSTELSVGLSIGERRDPKTDIDIANMLVQARFSAD